VLIVFRLSATGSGGPACPDKVRLLRDLVDTYGSPLLPCHRHSSLWWRQHGPSHGTGTCLRCKNRNLVASF